jgi:hypothetical protein
MRLDDTPPDGDVSRRRFLGLAGVFGLVGLLWPTVRARFLPGSAPQRTRRVASHRNRTGRWSDPSTWDGASPRSGDRVVIRGRVVLDQDRDVAELVIQSDGELIFSPSKSVTLSSEGNVVVNGVLTMRPSRPRIRHTLVFPSVDESAFVGGGMDVLASDVGLWVMGAGRLNLAGASRTPWVRAAGSIGAGDNEIRLASAPTGWRPGDTVVITPTVPPTQEGHSLAYDTGVIAAIHGMTITLARQTTHDHPAVEIGPGPAIGAEVLNLTRNVRIQGTRKGRAHVFIRSTSPQAVRGTALRFMGPRHGVTGSSTFVLGRYGIHLHMCGDGSRGSVLDSVVITDTGSHAFVAHMSDGVTMKGCISHNTFEDAFWYDGSAGVGTVGDPTNDLALRNCVASLVQVDPPFRGYRVSGFSLDRGVGNSAVGCVAVGVQGNKEASGFGWPQESGDPGNWIFEDNLAHNNAVSGIFVWQITTEANYVRRFTAFHNGVAGIDHGAYLSSFVYQDCSLFGNLEAGVVLHANSRDEPQLVFSRLHVDGSGFSPHGVAVARHSTPAYAYTRIDGSTFRGHTVAGIAWIPRGSSHAELFDVVNCTFEGNPFWLASDIDPASVIHVNDDVHGSITLRRGDRPGTFVPAWNASETTS